MLRLIVSEFKKIFKIKLNIILIVIAIIGTMSFAYLKYYEYDDSSDYNFQYANLDGETISGVEVIQNVDKVLHKYKGEWNKDTITRLDTEYKKLLQQFPADEIDEMEMEKHYGKNYKQLVEHFQNGTLTNEVVDKYISENDIGLYLVEPVDKPEGPNLSNIPIYYKNTPIRNLICKSFTGNSLSRYSDQDNAVINTEEYNYMLSVVDERKVDLPKGFELEVLQYYGLSEKEIEQLYNYLEVQVQTLPTTFDSSLPNEMLILTLLSTLWIAILAIMIILANTFSMEKQYNMDQLIYSTKQGKLKITIAKVITCSLFSIMMMGVIILSCFIVSWIVLPVHTWDMSMFSGSIQNSAFTYSYLFMYMFMLVMTAALATGVLTMMISYITKNQFVVIIAMFLFTVAGFPLSQSGTYPDLILSILPYNMMIFAGYFANPHFNFPYAFINDQVIPLRDVALSVWPVLFLIICVGIIIHSRKSYIRS
ncbi:MAG: hypothetical protein RR585_15300 [Coprobacillus sp.]